ncbi:MAG: hypothetical protein ACE5JD_03980 [Candidatus Methylomirabilia bacterium]
MGRRWYPELIPDIEMLDADGRFALVTLYPDGLCTIREFDPQELDPDDEAAN